MSVALDSKHPGWAEHSFSGIMFDISATGPVPAVVSGFCVGGLLGTMRVFTTQDGPMKGKESSRSSWEMVAQVTMPPAWGTLERLPLDTPVVIMPGERRGFYIHSAVLGNRGLQYLHCSGKNDCVAADKHLTVHAGKSHTSPRPFDMQRGCFWGPRGLAGRVEYTVVYPAWAPTTHLQLGGEFKDAVRALLLCHHAAARRGEDEFHPLAALPLGVVFKILSMCPWDWFFESEESRRRRKPQGVMARIAAKLACFGGADGAGAAAARTAGASSVVSVRLSAGSSRPDRAATLAQRMADSMRRSGVPKLTDDASYNNFLASLSDTPSGAAQLAAAGAAAAVVRATEEAQPAAQPAAQAAAQPAAQALAQPAAELEEQQQQQRGGGARVQADMQGGEAVLPPVAPPAADAPFFQVPVQGDAWERHLLVGAVAGVSPQDEAGGVTTPLLQPHAAALAAGGVACC